MSTKKIFVGNLPFTATREEVADLFAAHGEVHEINLINDRETGRPRVLCGHHGSRHRPPARLRFRRDG